MKENIIILFLKVILLIMKCYQSKLEFKYIYIFKKKRFFLRIILGLIKKYKILYILQFKTQNLGRRQKWLEN